MPNMTKISDGIYLVRSQAGFMNALRAQFSSDFNDWREIAAKRVPGHPKSYPSVVTLYYGYNGSTVFCCNAVHVNTLKAALEGQ